MAKARPYEDGRSPTKIIGTDGRLPDKGRSPIVTLPDERLHERRPVLVSTDGEDNDDEAMATEQDDAELLALARRRFQTSYNAEATLRQEMVQDQRFYGGHQWPDQIKADRTNDKRPILTINRLPQFVKQITNPQRQARPSIQVNPVGDGADPDTAEVIQGLIRHIENTSHAEVAYDEAYEDAVIMGRGWFRILTEYVDEFTADQQEIVVKRIPNALSVYVDPAADELDYSDARYMFIVEDIPKDEYRDLYGDASMSSLETFMGGVGNQATDWFPEGRIRIAEYFYVTHKESTLCLIEMPPEPPPVSTDGMPPEGGAPAMPPAGGTPGPPGAPPAVPGGPPSLGGGAPTLGSLVGAPGQTPAPTGPTLGDLLTVPEAYVPEGATILKKRKVKMPVVNWIKMNASEVLERKTLQGRWIPVVPILGDEIMIDGQRTLVGIVRFARDPQRMYNFWVAVSLDTPIATPTGWTTMGVVSVGEKICDANGVVCAVIGKSPIYQDRDCFKVTFDDGSSVVADREHPWQVEERGKRKDPTCEWTTKTVTTAELTPKKHFIWATKSLDLPTVDLPLPPYTLGMWLAEGTRKTGGFTQGDEDREELRNLLEADGCQLGPVEAGGIRFSAYGLRAGLRAAGVFSEKQIPLMYLRASHAQRLALLQGLMDGDGSISRKTRLCEFSTSSLLMLNGFTELLATFGIKAKAITRTGRTIRSPKHGKVYPCKPNYQFSFSAPPASELPLFRYERKLAIQRAKTHFHRRRTDRFGIRSVESVPSVPVQCLTTDSPTHLYLVGSSMVPTHNTHLTEMIALAPRVPFVGAEGQFKGHETEWKQANVKNFPYLEYVPVSLDGKPVAAPTRQQFEPPIQAAATAVKQADNDLKAVIGLYDASLGEKGPDQSGKAILARQKQGETANVNFIDNFGRSLWHAARIYLDLIPKVFDTPRAIHIMGGDDQRKQITINDTFIEQGVEKIYDVRVGRYNVTMSVGPSYQSRRQEAVASMLQLVQANPTIFPAIGDLLVGEMDWPMAKPIADRLKKLLPPQLQDQEDGDQPPLPPQAAAKVAQMEAQLQDATQKLQQAGMIIQTKQTESASRERIAKYQVDSRERMAAADREVKITVAVLSSKVENLQNEMQVFTEERKRLGLQDEAQKGRSHDAAMAAMDHANTLHQDQAGAKQDADLSAQEHQQTLAQGQQDADLAPPPASGGGNGNGSKAAAS